LRGEKDPGVVIKDDFLVIRKENVGLNPANLQKGVSPPKKEGGNG